MINVHLLCFEVWISNCWCGAPCASARKQWIDNRMDDDGLIVWFEALYAYFNNSFRVLPMRGIGKLVENSENNIAVVIKPGIYIEYFCILRDYTPRLKLRHINERDARHSLRQTITAKPPVMYRQTFSMWPATVQNLLGFRGFVSSGWSL